MARYDEALAMLKEGNDPIEIAGKMGISVQSVCQYLELNIGMGKLRRSDVWFSVSRDRRAAPPDLSYVSLLKRYADGGRAYGDLYDDARAIESMLHTIVRAVLQQVFGNAESGWWRKGVPLTIREKCSIRHQADEEPCSELYAYTDLIDIASIIDANWKHFISILPEEFANNRKEFLSRFRKFNDIRNKVMHPVREAFPTQEDFEFARQFRKGVASFRGDVAMEALAALAPVAAPGNGALTLEEIRQFREKQGSTSA